MGQSLGIYLNKWQLHPIIIETLNESLSSDKISKCICCYFSFVYMDNKCELGIKGKYCQVDYTSPCIVLHKFD